MPRTRSFGGCGMCRSRHMKCDETRPKCSTCAAYGLECDGYTKLIFFETDNEDRSARYRQLLFNDKERQHMNNLMTFEVPLHTTHATLVAIDTQCETAVGETCFDVHKGPFGAFKLGQSSDTISSDSSALVRRRSLSAGFDLSDIDAFHLPEWAESSSLFDFDGSAITPSFYPDLAALQVPVGSAVSEQDSFEHWLASPSISASDSLLERAPLLLKHYSDHVIPSLTPFLHTKTPWHVLFLPSAKNTLAGFAMKEDVDDADLTIFYGILAISALGLHHKSSGTKWHVETTSLEKKARESYRSVRQRALDRPKAFKYKSNLMATLIMIQISIANGTWEETDIRFLEAERTIKLRGITKTNKSRKVRILHHCYAYMRFFHESLSFCPVASSSRAQLTNVVEQAGMFVQGQDNLSFRVLTWDDLDQKFLEAKNQEQGENDLHLASPGLWPATLYPEIFGVPEVWLSLLSQVIRLGNEKDLSETKAPTLSLTEFSSRAKALERCILNWDESASTSIVESSTHKSLQIVNIDWIMLESMLSALRHALVIYFYRRIHDIDPEMLQSKVSKVKDFLFACKEVCASSGRFVSALTWPAFIAGCEATSDDLQESFSEWFRLCLQRNGNQSSARLQRVMEKVWHERRQDCRPSTSWLKLLRSSTILYG